MKRFVYAVLLSWSVTAFSADAQSSLRLTMDVKADKNERTIGQGRDGDATVEQVKLEVFIRQRSGKIYEAPLTAELYVIGQQIQTGYYGIIDVVKKEFTFSKENDRSFEFDTKMYQIGKTSGNIDVGGEYVTYLLVVADAEGVLLDSRSGRRIKEEGIAFIRELGPNTLFDRDGNVIGSVDDPGQAFKRAVPAAVSGGNRLR